MTITIPFEKLKPWLQARWQWLVNVLIGVFKEVVTHVRAKPVFGVIALVVGLAFGLWLGPRAGVLWFLFTLFLLYEWENRVFGVVALLCLAACPILLALKLDDVAEQVAVYAYFFLVMTVALQLVEFKRHPERFPEDEKAPDA
jgi:signal transduction histidine kinase